MQVIKLEILKKERFVEDGLSKFVEIEGLDVETLAELPTSEHPLELKRRVYNIRHVRSAGNLIPQLYAVEENDDGYFNLLIQISADMVNEKISATARKAYAEALQVGRREGFSKGVESEKIRRSKESLVGRIKKLFAI
jgi:hypothetical protein